MKIAPHRIHPAANIFPLMSDDEFARLTADIKRHGQLEPIVLLDGAVLDGRHRLGACENLGKEPTFRDLGHCEDPIGFVLAANLHRRHLITGQRSLVAARVAKLENGTNQHKWRLEGVQNCAPMTIGAAARMFAVSARSINFAKQIIERAHISVVIAVEQGKVNVSLAARFVNKVKNKEQQRRIVNLGVGEIRKIVGKELNLNQRVEKLVNLITKMREKWPSKHLPTLTRELAALANEINEGLPCPDSKRSEK